MPYRSDDEQVRKRKRIILLKTVICRTLWQFIIYSHNIIYDFRTIIIVLRSYGSKICGKFAQIDREGQIIYDFNKDLIYVYITDIRRI